jgi:hypothetical protein
MDWWSSISKDPQLWMKITSENVNLNNNLNKVKLELDQTKSILRLTENKLDIANRKINNLKNELFELKKKLQKKN